MQVENIAGILKFQGIPPAVAQSTVEALANVEWRASAIAKRHDVTRIRELVDIHQRNALSAGYDRARGFSDALLSEVLPKVFTAISGEYDLEFSKISAPQFTKYQQSHFIAPHRDTGAAYPERIFSAVTYLTEDYKGGDIDFPTIRRRFHPKQGETLVFPAEMLHAVRPLEAGEKQIFLFFVDRN